MTYLGLNVKSSFWSQISGKIEIQTFLRSNKFSAKWPLTGIIILSHPVDTFIVIGFGPQLFLDRTTDENAIKIYVHVQ